ncbi:TonB-dependent receptor plug domain-containing protein [candidate division CSSED10-310 bacterium]|uniref:TonB-dependent receptor plug domain-containing protein n=1 Tax=candidate division CSSED10-310 bacterium TaxID=2855610 RepID=A0ABV6YXN9_UNCC1
MYFFEMSLDEMELLPVVTASRKEEKLRDAPATIMVITAQQIKERGYEQLEDVLRDVPGIDLVHVNGTWPTIWAQRGLYGDENKRTLLLIDGLVENNILEGSVLGGPQYSLHHVERIEIIWGPASALYGANAFGGIINIITRKGSTINGIEYHKGYGSDNTFSDKFLIGYGRDQVDFTLSGSLYRTDGPVFEERHPQYSNSYVDNAFSLVSRFRYKSFKIGYSVFDRPMGEGLFSNSPAVQHYGLPPYGYQNSEGTDGGSAQTDLNDEKPSLWHSVTQTLFCSSELAVNESLTMNGTCYYRKTEIAADSYSYDYRNGAFHRDPYQHVSDLFGTELQLDYSLTSNQDIILGINYEQINVEKGYRATQAIDETTSILLGSSERIYNIYHNLAFFGQYRWRLETSIPTNFIIGLRHDTNNIYGDTTNPRLGIVSRLFKKATLKVLYGTAYRAPNNFELFTETSVRIANPELSPEREKTFAIDFSYIYSNHVQFELNFFHNDFDEIIVSNVETDIPIPGQDGEFYKQTQNQGEAEVSGVELKVVSDFTKNVHGFLNVSYQEGQQNDGHESYDIPNTARIKANLGLTITVPDILSLYVVENIVGARTTAVTNPDDSTAGYYLTNLTLTTKKLFKNRFQASVSVDNVFDTWWEDPGIRSATGGYYGTRHPQPGRAAFVSLHFSFQD